MDSKSTINVDQITAKVVQFHEKFDRARQEISKVIVGQTGLIDRLFLALLADGHLLVEGLPGLAKTLTVNTLAKVLNCTFKRIQFTPDLLPADLIGTTIYQQKDGLFTVKKGPIFTNILLADEINRAPPKVQSALLEVMQERQVTIGNETFKVNNPYIVLATQNPVEQAGTYPLPEAQTDRFMMKVKVDYPTIEEEKEIVKRMGTLGVKPEASSVLTGEEILAARAVVNEIYLDPKVMDYILSIVFATRDPKKYKVNIEGLLEFGASPRASIALAICCKARAFMEKRGFVTPNDVKSICHDILRHRIRLSYEAEAQEITSDQVIDRILETLAVP